MTIDTPSFSKPAGRGRAGRIAMGGTAQEALARGMALGARVLGPTIGPLASSVAFERSGRRDVAPELLNDGGTIARRLLGVQDQFADMGVMMIRHVAWRQWTLAGDGSAIAAVLCAAMHSELRRCGISGGHGDRQIFDDVARWTVDAVRCRSRTIGPSEEATLLHQLASSSDWGGAVVRAVDAMGTEGVIVVRDAPFPDVTCQFVDGSMWDVNIPSFDQQAGGQLELSVPSPRVLVWDARLVADMALSDLLDRLIAEGVKSLLVVARSFGDGALSALLGASGGPLRVVPIEAPFGGQHQSWALSDIAAVAGCGVLSPEGGDRMSPELAPRLGVVRRALLGRRYLNLAGFDLGSEAILAERARVRNLMSSNESLEDHRHLAERLGRLSGGMAIVWVGGLTDTERQARRLSVDQGLATLQAARRDGVVAGGGRTLVDAATDLTTAGHSRGAEALVRGAVANALVAPLWWLARNHGLSPQRMLASVQGAQPGDGVDVRSGATVSLWRAGIIDPASVVSSSVATAASGASLALSAAVLVPRGGVGIAAGDAQP